MNPDQLLGILPNSGPKGSWGQHPLTLATAGSSSCNSVRCSLLALLLEDFYLWLLDPCFCIAPGDTEGG